jgi:hypothetical protein
MKLTTFDPNVITAQTSAGPTISIIDMDGNGLMIALLRNTTHIPLDTLARIHIYPDGKVEVEKCKS